MNLKLEGRGVGEFKWRSHVCKGACLIRESDPAAPTAAKDDTSGRRGGGGDAARDGGSFDARGCVQGQL